MKHRINNETGKTFLQEHLRIERICLNNQTSAFGELHGTGALKS